MLTALLTTFGLVFVAELGDKTQVLVAWLASRYDARHVMLGVGLGSAAIDGLGVAVGVAVGSFVPQTFVELAAGILFIFFALLAFREARREDDDDAEETPDFVGRRPVLGTAAFFFLAELGDKTQIMVLALAAQLASQPDTQSVSSIAALWVGAVLAMAAADGLAVVAGTILGARVQRSTLAWISGALFAAFGLFTLGRVLLDVVG